MMKSISKAIAFTEAQIIFLVFGSADYRSCLKQSVRLVSKTTFRERRKISENENYYKLPHKGLHRCSNQNFRQRKMPRKSIFCRSVAAMWKTWRIKNPQLHSEKKKSDKKRKMNQKTITETGKIKIIIT